jgi:hypothetical protein
MENNLPSPGTDIEASSGHGSVCCLLNLVDLPNTAILRLTFRALHGLVIEASMYASTKAGRKEKERERLWRRGRRGWWGEKLDSVHICLSIQSVLGNVYLFVCLSSLLSPAFSSVSGFEGAPAVVSEECTRDSSPGPFVTSYTEGGLKERRRGFRVSRF